MKILHTSDWHLGRQFHGVSLESDHAVILDQVLDAVQVHDPDVLIIAGDIYDRASPPTSAVRQFNEFLRRVHDGSRAVIVMIAGNHDSGDRIGSMAAFPNQRALIRGPLSAEERPLILHDAHGPVVFSALPFGNEFAARQCFDDVGINTPADVLAAQMMAARAHVPADARWVVTAHAFVTSAQPCESERRLMVGGVETVAAETFAGAHYVALGHLHRAQAVGAGHIRYSGAPLAFGFDEGGSEKSMALITLAGDGSVTSELLPLRPLRGVRTLRGKLSELIEQGEASDDFIKVVLTDLDTQSDPMGKLRVFYPHALVLGYERHERALETKSLTGAQSPLDDPHQVIAEFLTYVRDEPPNAAESLVIDEALAQLMHEEASI